MTTTPTPEIDTRPLGQRLKEDNWDLHQQAEHDTLPQHMVRGSLPKEAFVEMLGQLWLANKRLDEAIAAKRDEVPILAGLVTDRQLQTQYLQADLSHYGVETSTLTASPGTAAMIERIAAYESDDPLGLFGLHYVREGANNGNRFVAMKLKQGWGVPMEQAEGFRYLDPYGAEQRPLWESFKERLNAFELTEDEKRRVVASARGMFEMMIAMHKDFDLPPLPPAEAGGGHGGGHGHGHGSGHPHAGAAGGSRGGGR